MKLKARAMVRDASFMLAFWRVSDDVVSGQTVDSVISYRKVLSLKWKLIVRVVVVCWRY